MEFLLELLTEELPASHVRSAVEQLEAGFRKELLEARIEVRSLKTLATPRRLVVAGDFAEGQEDREEVVTGPPLTIAKGPDGALTAAGKGFARSQGIDEGAAVRVVGLGDEPRVGGDRRHARRSREIRRPAERIRARRA